MGKRRALGHHVDAVQDMMAIHLAASTDLIPGKPTYQSHCQRAARHKGLAIGVPKFVETIDDIEDK